MWTSDHLTTLYGGIIRCPHTFGCVLYVQICRVKTHDFYLYIYIAKCLRIENEMFYRKIWDVAGSWSLNHNTLGDPCSTGPLCYWILLFLLKKQLRNSCCTGFSEMGGIRSKNKTHNLFIRYLTVGVAVSIGCVLLSSKFFRGSLFLGPVWLSRKDS